MTIAIRVANLGKRYRIGVREQGNKTLREAIVGAAGAPLRNLSRLRSLSKFADENGGGPADDTIWALKDVSFDVREGEVVGIIGANGAGKSTLLKVLSHITEPTTGFVQVKGRVSSLLEVGTGFHPELTGRENVYLNAAVLGMRKKEIERKFDEIVDFSGVEKFIDTPVKRYSSGMQVRLAFAVAAHLEPEVLTVDEVLAVGDAAFQKKCLGKMGEVAKEGRTVLFVSHNMAAVQSLCTRAIWLKAGMTGADGEAKQIVANYLDSNNDGFEEISVSRYKTAQNKGLKITKVVCRNELGETSTSFKFAEAIEVEIHYFAERKISLPYFWLGIVSQFGPLGSANMLLDGKRPESLEGAGILKCVFKNIRLLPQIYGLVVGVRGEDGLSTIIDATDLGSFRVNGTAQDIGFDSPIADGFLNGSAPLVLSYEWHMPDGHVEKIDYQSKKVAIKNELE